MKLWHVVEHEGLEDHDPRIDWFSNKQGAIKCMKGWLAEHKEQSDVVSDNVVEVFLVEIPTKRDDLIRWLWAHDVKGV